MTRVEQAIEVAVPPHTAYNQWTRFEQFPRFMQGVQEVRQIDAAHLHWVAECDGRKMEWDTELTEQVPDQLVSWRSTSGAPNTGTVRFTPLAGDRTQVTVLMESDSPRDGGGTPPDEKMLSERVREDMQRFKVLLETQGTDAGAEGGQSGPGEATGSTRVQPRDGQPSTPPASAGPAWLPNLSSMWEEPFSMMRRMSEEMDRMVERFIGRTPGFSAAGGLSQWTPAVEVSQQGNEMIINADLPGMSREDVKVEVRGDKLIIEGQRQESEQSSDPLLRRSERRFGRFYRMVALPQGAVTDAAQATMSRGVLQVRMPVADMQSSGRIIDVRQGPPLLQDQESAALPTPEPTSVGEPTGAAGNVQPEIQAGMQPVMQPGMQKDQQPPPSALH